MRDGVNLQPTTQYSVELPIYQGPLALLLDLIERAELDITKIALAQVTDQYLAYLETMPERSLEDMAAFLVVATRLLQIKSEALLPRPPERGPDEEDPGEALARQLREYRRFKAVAGFLAEQEAAGRRTYLRLGGEVAVEPTLDLAGLGADDLRQAYREALRRRTNGAMIERSVSPPKVRLRDQIRRIIAALRQKGRATFRQLLRRARTRLEIVVSFLAILELIKQRQVRARQERLFGDIELLPGESWQGGQEAEFDLEFEE